MDVEEDGFFGTHPKVFGPQGRLGVTMTAPTLSARELSLRADTDVIGWIQRENAVRQAEMSAKPGLFCMMVAESVAGDCANVYEYERDMAWNTYSDVYKELYSFRPRHDFSTWTLEDFERANKELFEEAERTYEARKAEWEAEKAYWAEEEKREASEAEEYRLIDAQEAREHREDQEYDEQDRLSGV